MTGTPDLLEVKGLTTTFHRNGRPLRALYNIDFKIAQGEVRGVVGESGSGKSVMLRSIMGLSRRYGDVGGEVLWQGRDLTRLNDRALRTVRGRQIAMIFQEPMTSLNPLLTVGLQLDETLHAHTDMGKAARRDRAVEMLDLVGIPSAADRLVDYPHQFSGGMRQRAMIAIALAAEPRLLLADEPTTALDVTIQAQILELIRKLADELSMAVVLVTHDLGVVAQTCEQVSVMYAGRIVEEGRVEDVLAHPRHPYTLGLMKSVPQDIAPRTQLYSVPGTPPALDALPPGCAFAPRCARAAGPCLDREPTLGTLGPERAVACFDPVGKAVMPQKAQTGVAR